MNIMKTIKLQIKVTKKSVICSDLTTLQLVLGTKSVPGNLLYYNVKKINNKYIVPILFVKDRIKIIENRRNKLNENLDIMRQVVK